MVSHFVFGYLIQYFKGISSLWFYMTIVYVSSNLDKRTDSLSVCTEQADVQLDKQLHLEDASFHEAEMDVATKSATSTKEDIEEDIDETELSKIKEFLEETVTSNI